MKRKNFLLVQYLQFLDGFFHGSGFGFSGSDLVPDSGKKGRSGSGKKPGSKTHDLLLDFFKIISNPSVF